MLRPSTYWIARRAMGVPSCVLLDVRIPELSGPELQERLSELGSTLPIIFLTGHPDVPVTVRAIKAGADDFHRTFFFWQSSARLSITK
jgi:FixJ family two-component response regulator